MYEQTAVGPHGPEEHGEHHLPPPSFMPLILAIGIAASIAGLVISPVVWIVGLAVVVVALAGWFREIGQDILEAPADIEI